MVQTPVIASIDFYTVAQMSLVLVLALLFAVYKTISRCLRHREKKMKIEKGIVGTQGKGAGSAKWIRSFYIAVPLLIASSVSIAMVVFNEGGLSLDGMQFVFCVIPFCVGIAYLIRGILKRKSYIRRLCLVYNFGDTILLISVLVASVLGGVFFLYGLLTYIVMSRRKTTP